MSPLCPQPSTEKTGTEHCFPIATASGGRGEGVKDPVICFEGLLKVRDIESWRSWNGASRMHGDMQATGGRLSSESDQHSAQVT